MSTYCLELDDHRFAPKVLVRDCTEDELRSAIHEECRKWAEITESPAIHWVLRIGDPFTPDGVMAAETELIDAGTFTA